VSRLPLKTSIAEGERLAASILKGLDGALCCKLRELKAELEQLREIFRQAKGRKISGCETWEQFCSTKLHRTARAVRMLLAESSGQVKEQRKRAEETSRPPIDHIDLAKKQLRQVLGTGESVEKIQETLVSITDSLFPSRRIVVEVREIEVPWTGQEEEDAAIVSGEVGF
jgi:hypothetical protein